MKGLAHGRGTHHGAGTRKHACCAVQAKYSQPELLPTSRRCNCTRLRLVKGPRVVHRVRGAGARRRCCLSARHVRQQSKGCVPKGAWHAGKPPPCHAANRQSCLRLVCKRVPFTLLAHTKTCRDASAAPSVGQEQPGATHTRQTKQQTKGKRSLPVTVTGGTHGEGMQLTEAGLERPHS